MCCMRKVVVLPNKSRCSFDVFVTVAFVAWRKDDPSAKKILEVETTFR